MSQKWIRSKAWDDAHIPAALWPVKFVLRTFSSIPLAVVLLVLVALYGTMASVPVGLIAMVPTWLVYALTFLIAVAFIAVIPSWALNRVLMTRGVAFGTRFAVVFPSLLLLVVLGAWVWHALAWPALRYDSLTQSGFRMFGTFIDAHKSTTVRRLRGMEMSELEFYGWWPLRVVLLMFVVNMVTATVRRIEFTFKNIGVLTVHTGIVLMALGSMYYSALKEEGDMVLQSGALDQTGVPTVGAGETGFYDNTTVALWVNSGKQWEQRPLQGVPRYNDYNLDALGLGHLPDGSPDASAAYKLDIPAVLPPSSKTTTNIDPDISMRVVGYAPYAELTPQWVRKDSPAAAAGKEMGSSLWWVRVSAPSMGAERRFPLWPTLPRGRVIAMGGALEVEFTKGMPEDRWRDLQSPIPGGATSALVIEANGARDVFAAQPGKPIDFQGYKVQVEQVMPQPPFPIITPGYEGGQSSVAIVRVTPPTGKPFERYCYHRFPEISQDMLEELNERGMPKRRDADKSIRITFIDASVSQVFFDEVFGTERDAGGPVVRAILRPRGGQATVTQNMKIGSTLPIGPAVSLVLDERWDDSAELEVPSPTPLKKRENKDLGTHRFAAIAVEVSANDNGKPWKHIAWVPFAQYIFKEMDQARTVDLPGGRHLTLGFGRMMRTLPGLELQLKEFKMIPHAFGGPTQDFRSDLQVNQTTTDGMTSVERYTSLNDPLLVRVPFQSRANVPKFANMVMRVVSVVAPTQYKFSQAGWDAEGWNRTQAEVEAGQRARAFARWTILGVGNNPGIYIIATGAVMMGVGIPWAFYVKPLLVQREKKKIQRKLAADRAGTSDGSVALSPQAGTNGTSSNGSAQHHSVGVDS